MMAAQNSCSDLKSKQVNLKMKLESPYKKSKVSLKVDDSAEPFQLTKHLAA